MSRQDRAPVMVPAPATDRGRRIVRHRRLVVEDGALVLAHEDGHRKVLAGSGEVVAATWVPDTAGRPEALVRETLELFLRDGAVLAVPLDDWLGTGWRAVPVDRAGSAVAPLDATGSTAMRISGADAVVTALGLRVSTARALSGKAREVPAGGRLPTWSRLVLWAWALPALLFFVVLLAAPFSDPSRDGQVLRASFVLLGIALLAGLATGQALQAAAQRDLDRGDLPAPPWRPEPTVPASRAHVQVALLSAGHDWLVGREENGREVWLPGPELGGVVTALTVGSWLAFEDASGTTLHQVFWPAWGDRPRLEQVVEELAGRGYEVVRDPGPEPTGPPWRPPPYIEDQMQLARDGGPHRLFLASGFTPLVAVPLVLLAAGGALPPLAAVPAVLAVALAVVDVVRLVRRVRSLRPRPPEELVRPIG